MGTWFHFSVYVTVVFRIQVEAVLIWEHDNTKFSSRVCDLSCYKLLASWQYHTTRHEFPPVERAPCPPRGFLGKLVTIVVPWAVFARCDSPHSWFRCSVWHTEERLPLRSRLWVRGNSSSARSWFAFKVRERCVCVANTTYVLCILTFWFTDKFCNH